MEIPSRAFFTGIMLGHIIEILLSIQSFIKRVINRRGNIFMYSVNIDVSQQAADKKLRGTEPWIGIIIHHTGVVNKIEFTDADWESMFNGNANWLSKTDDSYVSAHFLVGRKGQIKQLVDPKTHIAYHAGESSFWNPNQRKWLKFCNPHFIGIEMLGDGNIVRYSDEQYESCAKLCAGLMKENEWITPNCIVGHEMIAPDRKVDPGKYFNWGKFFTLLYLGFLETK